MTTKNYSITDIMNLAYEAKEIATFQNSVAIDSGVFSSAFKKELDETLLDKVSKVEHSLSAIEFKVKTVE